MKLNQRSDKVLLKELIALERQRLSLVKRMGVRQSILETRAVMRIFHGRGPAEKAA